MRRSKVMELSLRRFTAVTDLNYLPSSEVPLAPAASSAFSGALSALLMTKNPHTAAPATSTQMITMNMICHIGILYPITSPFIALEFANAYRLYLHA